VKPRPDAAWSTAAQKQPVSAIGTGTVYCTHQLLSADSLRCKRSTRIELAGGHDSGCAGAPTRSLRWRVASGGGPTPRSAPACARARWSHSSCTHGGVARLLRAGFTKHGYCALEWAVAAWMATPACIMHALCARRAVTMRASRAGACSALASTAVLGVCPVRECVERRCRPRNRWERRCR
jgi:hypothetical protein